MILNITHAIYLTYIIYIYYIQFNDSLHFNITVRSFIKESSKEILSIHLDDFVTLI